MKKLLGRRKLSHICYLLPVILITFLPLCADATTIDFYTDGTIQSGDTYDRVNVWNTATLEMTGGTANSLYTYDSSTLQLQNGNISSYISVYDESILEISGGTVGNLQVYDSSVTYLTGGSINGTLAIRGAAVVHIYGQNFNYTQNVSGWLI